MKTTTLTHRLQQLNLRALRRKSTGAYYFCATDIIALLCNTPLHTAKSYWHYIKRTDSYFEQAIRVNTQLNLPSADGRFRQTDVLDVRAVLHLLQTVKHKGAREVQMLAECVGLLWVISLLKAVAFERSQQIVAQANRCGKGFVMRLVRIARCFVVGVAAGDGGIGLVA